MKRLMFVFLLVVVLAGVIYYFSQSDDCKPADIQTIRLKGDAQFLVDGHNNDEIIYAGILFTSDSLELTIYNGTDPLCREFIYCDVFNDSLILAFDKESSPFLVNSSTGKRYPILINLDFRKQSLVNTIKIGKLGGHHGFFFNQGDSLHFVDVERNQSKIIFPNNGRKADESIEDFDVYADKILLCLSKGCSQGACSYEFILVDTRSGLAESVFSVDQSKSLSYAPSVAFVDSSTFITNYYEDLTHLALVSLKENRIKDQRCIDDLKVVNINPIGEKIYLTVLNEKVRTATVNQNPYENLYRGMSIISIDIPFKP